MRIDWDAVKSRHDLRDVVLGYTPLDRSGHGPCPLCGGHDRFYIHNGGERCGCRKCGFQGDVIELIHRVEQVSRIEAARILGAKSAAEEQPATGVTRSRQTKELEMPAWTRADWQSNAQRIIEESETRLLGSKGAAYLERRGIEPHTWKRYRVGFAPSHFGHQAIVLPWIDEMGLVTAVKYRFIQPRKNAKGEFRRYGAEKGSGCLLFGLNGFIGSDTLIVVEGEINALALAQSTPFNVLSIGSQGNRTGVDLVRGVLRSRNVARVLFWFDEEERTKKVIGEQILGAAGMKSPDGKDAADILLTHGGAVLRELVEAVLSNRYSKGLENP